MINKVFQYQNIIGLRKHVLVTIYIYFIKIRILSKSIVLTPLVNLFFLAFFFQNDIYILHIFRDYVFAVQFFLMEGKMTLTFVFF